MSLSSKFVQNSEFFFDKKNMEISSLGIWEKLSNLAKAQKKSLKGAAKVTGVSEGAISGWKKSFPTVDNLAYLAEYYGVSLDYLVFDEKSGGFSQEIISIAHKISSLDPKDRQDILDFIDIKLKKGKKGGKMTEAIAVMEPEPAYIPDITSIPFRKEVIDNVIYHEWGVIEVPLLGSTAAGQPIDFGDLDPEPPSRPWASDLIRGDPKNYYCVLVRGTSMTEADIKDGDYALLRRTEGAESGEIMLVRHDNSSTLKRIKVTKGAGGKEETYACWEDGSGHKVRLEGEGYEIQGKLVAIERKPGKR